MRISQVLFTQGFGSRRECAGIIQHGMVAVQGRTIGDAGEEFDTDGLVFTVQGRHWHFHEKALVLLHKPAGYECSSKPRHHPSVLSLLPTPLRTRGLQSVGRLDEDTTGLLLFTDDGSLIHRLTSPKHHVPKVYEVQAKHAVTDQQLAQLRSGVVLEDDPTPTLPASAERTGETTLRLTLVEGRYHQVKRMLAAVGNRVEGLHRSGFGALEVPARLAPGQWAWVDAADRARLVAKPAVPAA